MISFDDTTGPQLLQGFLSPWMNSIRNPQKAQEEVLHRYLFDYAKNDYGRLYGANNINSIKDYRSAFPIIDYDTIKPTIEGVMAGNLEAILSEEPIGWAITRGTTKGESKFIPMTPSDMSLRINAGRAMMNYVLTSKRFDLFSGVNLNLNFPSKVGEIFVNGNGIEYGYSSGIYTKYVSQMTPIHSAPSQEEIDELGGGKSIKDWERRFDLAYNKCKDQNVTLVGGVCPTALRFGRYLKKSKNYYPKDIWKTQIMTLGSVPGINTRYAPALKAMYGSVTIREIYGATEGMFGQQMDEKKAWVPNYDLFFFEVVTHSGIKMLHEMKPREMGSLIVSTPILPRYKIGDLIRAFEPPYFRCIGRDTRFTLLQYFYDEFMTFNLDQL